MDNGKNNIVDTTDCLETVAVFKAAKNFFFIVCFLCLLITQGVFWSNQIGILEFDMSQSAAGQQETSQPSGTDTEPVDQVVLDTIEALHAESLKQAQGGTETGDAQTETQETPAQDTNSGENVVPEAVTKAVGKVKGYVFEPDWTLYKAILNLCNSILLVSAVLYCLIIVFTLKVSLVGRLGGMAWIASAFISSLMFLVFLLPWQTLFPQLSIAGAIYTPAELADWYSAKQEGGIYFGVLYYGRFVALWLIAFLLLWTAQLRSRRWAKASLKRLGLVG
ncbi:hypothetical protein SMSP2_01596 [Limihaloglobus sulfuriphilus]|uniref:Uncharacterized protein n=1 Tax=Limihaloglobus sulfuriphilus TaxID=1851148 RepID=A0A1Q2MEY1_9BACT|nr:hypothetical protein [Limihaloglobus sulfuriphilus]AQQ71230.1 hypothetical protein SMSP2_01596 [Limihaloglobus sulfuriphilus]